MSILIKRYPNRKLYDTASKRYIALEGISDLIRQGNGVKIVDHLTGEDLTTVILSQVILENEKKRTGFLPHSVLISLIQSGGTKIGSMRRELFSSIDPLINIEEEIERRFKLLAEAGDLTQEQAEDWIRKLSTVRQHKVDVLSPVEKTLKTILARRGVASRAELENLSRQIDEISAKLDALGRTQMNNIEND
jgi:polyhydroxyalkanoate synthesis repressor PhaR